MTAPPPHHTPIWRGTETFLLGGTLAPENVRVEHPWPPRLPQGALGRVRAVSCPRRAPHNPEGSGASGTVPIDGSHSGTGGRGEAGRGWTQRGTTRRKGQRENLKGRGAGQQRPRASFFSSPPALLQLSDCRGPIPNHKTRKALCENETKLSEKMPPSVHVCVCNKEKLIST